MASTRISEAIINSYSNTTRLIHFLNYLRHIHNVQDKLSPCPQSNRYSYKLDNLHCNLLCFDCPPIVISMIALSIIQYSLCLTDALSDFNQTLSKVQSIDNTNVRTYSCAFATFSTLIKGIRKLLWTLR